MSTADVILALLWPGPSHGYDVKRTHDRWFPEARPLAFGQVYASLGRLERDGLVEVVHIQAGDGPDRTIYALTAIGREQVAGWARDPVEPEPPGGGELVKRTVVAIRLGLDPAGFLARQRQTLLRRMHALSVDGSPDPFTRLAHDHALAHLDADLRWLDAAAQQLNSETSRSTR